MPSAEHVVALSWIVFVAVWVITPLGSKRNNSISFLNLDWFR